MNELWRIAPELDPHQYKTVDAFTLALCEAYPWMFQDDVETTVLTIQSWWNDHVHKLEEVTV